MLRDIKEIEKYINNMDKYKHKCKCGHTIYLSKAHPKKLCNWCNTMNYYDKKQEFEEKLKNALKKNKYMI